jgi:hypothetical protein
VHRHRAQVLRVALGLDHTFKCGDIMSYFLDRCGARKFMDVDAPCGEFSARVCGDGSKTQNSYRMIVNAVGLRQADPSSKPQPQPQPQPQPEPDADPDGDDADDDTNTPPNTTPNTTPDDSDDSNNSNNSDDTADEPAQKEPPRQGNARRGHTSVERYRDRSGRTWVVVRRWR